MCVSWSHDPENRPTAEQICQISASHQFCHLADAVSLNSSVGILNGCSVVVSDTVEEEDIGKSHDTRYCRLQCAVSTENKLSLWCILF